MNRHNAHQYALLVIALGDGKTIQVLREQPDGTHAWEDFGPEEEVLFTCEPSLYRVKPAQPPAVNSP